MLYSRKHLTFLHPQRIPQIPRPEARDVQPPWRPKAPPPQLPEEQLPKPIAAPPLRPPPRRYEANLWQSSLRGTFT